MTSGRCWPSAADEEWYSPKRPSSTVAVNSSGLNTKVSAFSIVYTQRYTIQLIGIVDVHSPPVVQLLAEGAILPSTQETKIQKTHMNKARFIYIQYKQKHVYCTYSDIYSLRKL